MHIICETCFKKAGPIEYKTKGDIDSEDKRCTYCGGAAKQHARYYLGGDNVDLQIFFKLHDLGDEPRKILELIDLDAQYIEDNIKFIAGQYAPDPVPEGRLDRLLKQLDLTFQARNAYLVALIDRIEIMGG